MSIRSLLTAITGVAAVWLLAAPPAGAQTSRNWTWCTNKGHANSTAQQIEGCSAIINAGKETRKNLSVAYNNRANGYADQKQYQQALADYDHSLRLNPDYAIAYRNRGLSYNALKNYDRAITDYDQAIRLNPRYEAAYNSRGSSYYSKKEYDRAIADYTEALKIDPNSSYPYRNRGLALVDKGEYDRAILDLDQAIRTRSKICRGLQRPRPRILLKGRL